MLEAALQALVTLFQPGNITMMLLGVGIGTLVGVLPGLGGIVGMSLALPFVFGLETGAALALLIGMAAVIHTADTFPSVLLGVPGSAGSQATIMDGYPLARQGQAGRALSAAFISSLLGGLIGALALLIVLPVARPLVLAFGSPELLMLTLLGLSMVGVLAGRYPLRGVITAALGLLLGAVGAAPSVAHFRYTFGSLYLYDGVPLAVLALGLFALPELLDLLAEKGSIAQRAELGKGRLEGLRDVLRERWLVVRSALLGIFVGFIPGLGGSVVDWISYGVAAQTVKNPEGFGKGDVRGVIAPEASNNAKEGGALIPTLLFGIPGSGTTAVLLGGFTLLGLQPGPRMITANLDILLLIIWTLAFANVFGALVCVALSGLVARLTVVPAARLVPFLLVLMLVGAYQSTRAWGDLLAFLVIGLFGWLMKRARWPLPPLLIGYVLSASAERYLFISSARFGPSFLLRPGVIAIALVTIGLVVLGMRLRARGRVSQEPLAAGWGALLLTLVLGLGVALLTFQATGFPPRARVFPLTVGLASLLFVALELVRLLWRGAAAPSADSSAPGFLAQTRDVAPYLVWVLALYAAIYAVGFLAASGLFVFVFLLTQAKMRLPFALLSAACCVGVVLLFGTVMGLEWPAGLLAQLGPELR